MANVSMQELLEAGAHFGHQTRRWNPKMGRFIFGKRSGIHIVDLQKTQAAIEEAVDYARGLARGGGRLLFVGTKRQAQSVVSEEAQACGQFYVSHRWLGGMLTNFVTIRKSVDKLEAIEGRLEDPEAQLTKKERVREGRQQESMSRALDGIRKMDSLPEAIFVVDPRKEHIAVAEANALGITVIGIVDTNCDPDFIDYPIPANDDSIRSIRLITRKIREAFQKGLGEGGFLQVSEEDAAAEETAAEVEVAEAAAEAPASDEAASDEAEVEAGAEDASAEEASAEETGAEEIGSEEASTEEASTEEASTEEAGTEEAAAEEPAAN